MICNHVLSGESIKRVEGLSTPPEKAPSVPSPPTPPTFDPGPSPFSSQAPTKYPCTWAATAAGGGPYKDRDWGGGLLIFHGPHSPMERGG